jgi:diadenosine tetraphosphatase ApaH/serine/threonine PP2A family protein phosphatase
MSRQYCHTTQLQLPYCMALATVMTTMLLLDVRRRQSYHANTNGFHSVVSSSDRQVENRYIRNSAATTLCSNLSSNRIEKYRTLPAQENCLNTENLRLRKTSVDDEFRKTATLPEPSQRHVILPPIENDSTERSGILVIGDVHGCYDEMMLLYEKAVRENDGILFHYVILVGDICNKGPQSMAVIRHVRENHPRWISIRGNHENSVLQAALQLPDAALLQGKYNWLVMGDEKSIGGIPLHFSDDDLVWMANLPYTIRIPGDVLGSSYDTIVVHAGLIPGLSLEQMDIQTFVVLRDLPSCRENHTTQQFPTQEQVVPTVPWASLWKSPEQIIFGHDAKRGLQEYEYATGIDTGCVYGKKLTGMILPQRKIVHINALKQYVPIKERGNNH